MTISFTRISDFIECPLLYAEKYLRRNLPPPEPHVVLGTACHALLAAHFFGRPLSEEDQKLLDALSPVERAEVDTRVQLVKDTWPAFPVRAAEANFRFELAPDIDVIGRIDLIEERPDGLHVVDWKFVKTGWNALPNAADRHSVSLQASIYYLGAQRLFPTDAVSPRVHFYHVGAGGFLEQPVDLTDRRIAADLRTLRYYAAQIAALEGQPPSQWPYNRAACVKGGWRCPYFDAHLECGIMEADGEGDDNA